MLQNKGGFMAKGRGLWLELPLIADAQIVAAKLAAASVGTTNTKLSRHNPTSKNMCIATRVGL